MRKLIIIFLFALCFAAQAFVPASDIANLNYQGSNFNVGGNASFEAGNLMNIVGSGVAVQDTLTLNADHVNIRAGVEENTSHSSSQTKTAGVTASTSAGGSVGANASQSKNEADSYSKTHVNSQISAGNINSDSQSFTLAGANVEIQNDINLNTQQLTVESVQDTHQSSSKGSSQSVGVTAGGGSINPSSIGAGQNSSSEDSQWVNNQSTLLGGGKVNITADKTTVTGAVVANASRDENGNLQDHGNMNLVTDELIINDLQDHNHTDSKGIDLSAGLSKSGTSSVGLQKDGHNTEQITYATLGGGTVTKKSGEQHDLTNTNRDINNTQEITLDQQTAGMNATVTVDHRLLSEGGRNAIKEDFTKTGMIVDTVALIATTNRVGITDFFKETGKKHTTYEGIKSEIANNPDLAKQLQNPDLTPDQKEAMLDQLTHRVMVDLGYSKEGYQNIIVANDKDYVQKEDGIYQRQGFYSEETQNAYINDAFIKDTKGLVTTAGHELSHAMDDRSGNNYSQQDNDTYANQFGNNFGSYTNTALGVTGNGSMASTNNHVGNNSQKVYTQTQSYNALDKNKGDDLLFLAAPAVPVITVEAVTAVATLATAVGLKVFGDDIAEAIGVESKPTILETPAIIPSAEDGRIDGSQAVEQGATVYTTPEHTDNNNLYVNIPEGTDISSNSGGYQGETFSLDDMVMMAEGASSYKAPSVNNMKEFFETSFGQNLQGISTKTSKQFQGQSIYTVNRGAGDFSRGDQFYLDGLHKDHIEVFDRRGNFKDVYNLDGKVNLDKTNKALSDGRKVKY